MALDADSIRELIPRFAEASERFYSGQMTAKEFKGISGGFGSYAQRCGDRGMVRLRLSGGRIDRTRLKFIADTVERYRPSMVHLTTCQSVQLHNLDGNVIPDIVDAAMDAGIFTYQGGGDNPRNVTATPLSGIIPAPLDVQPYAYCAERYVSGYAHGRRMPRKLKIGFANTLENGTDSTARDLGFVVRENGRFDVYSGGGLGPNPRLGLLVAEDVDPRDLCVYITAMVDMFIENGNFENRARARVRYMRDTLGDEGYTRRFREHVDRALADPSVPRVEPEGMETRKTGDGSVPTCPRARRQKQEGLYYIPYHPLGGDPDPGIFGRILSATEDMEDVEVRVSPAQTLYVVNLTGREADIVADLLSDGAETLFQASVACVGSTICQQGLRDSHGLLMELLGMERRNGFGDGVLPMVRISGCVSSCAAHQLGTVGLRGTTVDGEPAFTVNVNGSHLLGRERIGEDIGSVLTSELPAFFETIGRAVQASGKRFREWFNEDPSRLRTLCGEYLH
ncbi:MAG: nitrite/sulfite reductase [archaeon]|nr:nitrite/sulfite reductase [archaeon]